MLKRSSAEQEYRDAGFALLLVLIALALLSMIGMHLVSVGRTSLRAADNVRAAAIAEAAADGAVHEAAFRLLREAHTGSSAAPPPKAFLVR